MVGGVSETRAVQQWMTDREPQRPHVLRFALQVATMVAEQGADQSVVRAWFQGCNPHLNDAVPALLLRSEPLEKIQPGLLAAARLFAAR